MSKYDPLRDFLNNVSPQQNDITLSFAQVEQILGFSLPPSASNHRAWWANEVKATRPNVRAWMSTNWRVDEVNKKDYWVRFRRQR